MAIDTAFFDQIEAQLDFLEAKATKLAGRPGAELEALKRDVQTVINDTWPRMKAQYQGVINVMAQLQPALALLEANPANLAEVITVVKDIIQLVVGPIVLPYTSAAVQLPLLVAQVTRLVAKVETVAGKIEGFHPTIPSFP